MTGEEAINRLKEEIDDYTPFADKWNEARLDIKALNMAIQALEQTEWIPVSERLPEFTINNTVSEDVLVCDGVDIEIGEYRRKYLNGAGYWRVYGYDLEEYDVIAWMPLPKPYEPQKGVNE